MKLIPVEGNPGLARDKESGAILNINTKETEAARQRKLLRKQKEEEFEQLKKDVEDIKSMLSQIAERL